MENVILIIIISIIFYLIDLYEKLSQTLPVDQIDIGRGEHFYNSKGKLTPKQLKPLVRAFSNLDYSTVTTEEIDYSTAITVSFLQGDRIMGYIIIDDKGRFESKHTLDKYGEEHRAVNHKAKFYKLTAKIYNEIQNKS